jgi:hypothetical protein
VSEGHRFRRGGAAPEAMIREVRARVTIAILVLATIALALLLLVYGFSFLEALAN